MPRHTPYFAALSLTASLSLLPALAGAQTYDFDESCAPTTAHSTNAQAPDALFILDRSGSMNGAGGGGKTKLQLAKEAMVDLANAAHVPGPCMESDRSGCDDVRLGLGWFSNGSAVSVKPAENTRDAFVSTVNGYNTSGCTETGAAARSIFESAELRNAPRIGIGAIITDGQPYTCVSGVTTRATIERSLHYLCRAKIDHGIRTFMIGFGAGSNPRMNSLMAAAGGTGACCIAQADGTCQPVDPCLLPERTSTELNADLLLSGNSVRSNVLCGGSLEASSGQDLKNELLDLLQQISCTFPLDIPISYLRYPGADEDPAATRVEFDHTLLGSNIRVPHFDPANPNAFYNYLVNQKGVLPATAEPYKGEGWTFSDPSRRAITLTSKLCAEVVTNNVDVTETQAACLCPNTGENCEVPCTTPPTGSASADSAPPIACVTNAAGDLVQAGRCRLGFYECTYGVQSCAQRFSRQPEICNGLDDDCDGEIDNHSNARPSTTNTSDIRWDGNLAPLTSLGLDEGLFCGFADSLCVCAGGSHELSASAEPMHPDPDREWKLLLQSYASQKERCSCSAGLTYDETLIASHDSDADSDAAVCTISSPQHRNTPGGSLLLLALLGTCAVAGASRLRSTRR